MDAERFDSLARVLAAKTPRRAIFRGGAGFGAAWLGLVKLRPSSAASTVQLGRHTLIRQYAVTGKVSDARKALKGLVAEIEKAPGFVDYSVVDAGNGVLVTISIFNDQPTSAAAAQLETNWIKKHAAKQLPNQPSTLEGDAILHADLIVGCPCTTGVQDPCGNANLTCCAGEGAAPGGPGICITAATTCGAPATPTATVAPAPTQAPTEAPTEAPTQAAQCSANPGDSCSSNADCCVGSCGQGVCNCTDPSRPEVGCPCTTGDANACGGRPDTCCPTEPGANAAGTCLSPMATCDAKTGCRADGFACPTTCAAGQSCPKSQGGCCSGACLDDGTCGASAAPACADGGATCAGNGDCCSGKCNSSGICYCTDPDRPPIGCPCDASNSGACGGRADLCCSGTCISPMATCGA